ncbi:MAG: D-amino acid dehydrogenase [Rhodospirillaceae bacterium]|nr:D-amino acid dehydrogenase [Rhodospirillaceae bacterium]MBT5838945.1 D-amino acid dehydrogenase [Rhodospirillaceae bacterium]
MKVIVLGSGVIGICAAYYLNKAGHEVTVIDRQEGPGLETSFANGGQISASHAAPWAAPSVPLQMLKWLGRADAPLLYHFRLDWRQWVWSLRFLMNCLPSRARRNTIGNMRICLYSRALMPEIREDTGIEYDHRPDGILQIYENRNDLDSSARHAMWLRELGCDNKVLTRQECIALEPALAERADQLAGGIYTETDESGDAYKFTHELAAVCAARGVSFHYGETIEAIAADGARIGGIRTKGRTFEADAYVLSLGSYSPLFLRPLGISLPVFPTKGYSVTVPVSGLGSAPKISLTDHENRIVYSRLGDRLRVAGTAEFSGYDTELDEARARTILANAKARFPGAGDFSTAELWTGLRPLTPDGVPVVSATKYPNLFLDTGHGTLGWTMCAGSGKAIADLISGSAPEIDLAAFSIDRF